MSRVSPLDCYSAKASYIYHSSSRIIQTSFVEIERVCDRSDESILETAAVSVAPVNGGPELLVIYVVLKKGFDTKADELKTKFSRAIRRNLNPLFKVSFVKNVAEFPRTASNKLLRSFERPNEA